MSNHVTKIFHKIWGGFAIPHKPIRFRWIDFLLVLGIAGLFYGLVSVEREWTGAWQQTVEIDLNPWLLPKYTFFSMVRGIIAYCLSLMFTLVYGYWAAKDKIAEKVLVPLLDILQSIPVLGFMPGLVLTLVGLFPHSNIGLELAAIIMIFTGQVWNMTFSFYHSLCTVPADMRQVASIFQFNWWQTLNWIEVPHAAIGLIWNSMMSMAGGWFFLMISEAFVLGHNDFRLPGVGSYMSVAVNHGNFPAMVYAIIAMIVMVVLLDLFLWRPVVAWSQKFKQEETGAQFITSSFFLNWLRKAGLLQYIGGLFDYFINTGTRYFFSKKKAYVEESRRIHFPFRIFVWMMYAAFIGLFGFGCWRLSHLLQVLSLSSWGHISWYGCLTLLRVLSAVAIGTLWALPAGLMIGLSPKLSRIFQPVIQIVASFPAPMLFTPIIIFLQIISVGLGFGSIVLMLLGTQWYILFNVIAGATSIPADLRESSRLFGMSRWQRLKNLYVPAVFPFLVTGWVTATGGAWNASIVAEYAIFRGQTLTARGLGAMISQSAEKADFALLTGAVLTMSAIVVIFNRVVWRSLYNIAEKRYAIE
ncbi:MAG: ABC transporter permease subunit [Planctomycetes bacterium]|nr:ABC transporter permease subunit [Planctomycetota bacterium]